MKRHPSLEPFSRDHNDGLILARHLENKGIEAIGEFHEAWGRDLEDHFVEEERLLLPICDPEAGARLVSEHEEIKALGHAAKTDEDAQRLGRLLHDHIRWEERELFIAIERSQEATLRSLARETAGVERRRTEPRRVELVARRPKPEDTPALVDLRYLAAVAPTQGPRWGLESEDLNATLMVWNPGEGAGEHVNDEVDVLMVAIEGEGVVTMDGRPFTLSEGKALVVPKGARRSVTAGPTRFVHLNVHRRRRKLTVGHIPKRETN